MKDWAFLTTVEEMEAATNSLLENGKKVGEFEQFAEVDPDYMQIFTEKLSHIKGRAANYAKPAKSRYMFRIKPSEGVRSGEVRVKDNFGTTYTEKVEW
mgnify:CR=1 FL=1